MMGMHGHKGGNGPAGDVFAPAQYGKGRTFVWIIAFISIVVGLMPAGLGIYYAAARNNVHFVINGDGLVVEYKVGRITVAAEDIADVQYVSDPPRMRRVGGASLGDLQMGWYRWPEFGRVYRFTTTPGAYVVIDTAADVGASTSRANTRYVFDPVDGEKFVALLDGVRSGQSPAGDGVALFGPGAEGRMSPWPLTALGIVLVIPTGIVMPWLLLRGRRGMTYHVGPEGITVSHLGKKLYAWRDIQSVTAREEPLRGLLRTLGTALPGYYAGSFRARSLPNIQMNATRKSPPLIVIETGQRHLIITPDNMDGFMDAVARYRDGA